MITTPPALQNSESLDEYCKLVGQKVETQVKARLQFLANAVQKLAALRSVSDQAKDTSTVTEIDSLIMAATNEMAHLGAPGVQAANAEILMGNTAAAASIVAKSESTFRGAVPDRSTSREEVPRLIQPEIVRTPLRTQEEIFAEVTELTELVEIEDPDQSETRPIIRMKALLCRQRALQAELHQHGIEAYWPLRALAGQIRRKIDDRFGGNHYLIPLRQEFWPAEPWPWTRLSHLYECLVQADEALDWYDSEKEKLTPGEKQQFLESIAAHQTRLWRHLQAYFPRQTDEHQITFFHELREIAEEAQVYLFTLQEKCADKQLDDQAEELPLIIEQLTADVKKRPKFAEVIAELRTLLASESFGIHEDDVAKLATAVAACRKAGIAASSKTMRVILSDYLSLLSMSSEKAAVEVTKEIQKELDRIVRKEASRTPEVEAPMNDAETIRLDTVRNAVRGKRMVFLGGICRENVRTRLEKQLELTSLTWPSPRTGDGDPDFEDEIKNSDVTVVLIRFMRTGWAKEREIAQANKVPFVLLPRGYTTNEVVSQLQAQIGSTETPVAKSTE
ncbi:MAG: hypothetical protein ABJA67_07120 [Chthonomonadales bacterium]